MIILFTILPLYGRIQVSENPYSRIFYVVKTKLYPGKPGPCNYCLSVYFAGYHQSFKFFSLGFYF